MSGFSLSVLRLYHTICFWPAEFLQRNQLILLCSSLASFRIPSLTFAIFIMIYLDVSLLVFILFRNLCVFCTWISVFFFRFGKYPVIISSTTFDPIPLLFSFWDLYNVDVAAQRSLKLFAFFFVCLFFLFPFFKICLSFCCCDWVIFFILPSG